MLIVLNAKRYYLDIGIDNERGISLGGIYQMNKEKALEVLEMLKDYVNENWDEEYRNDINNVNDMYEFVVAALSTSSLVGNATINGKRYLISEDTN